jgi:hypothetical protein
LIEKLQHDNTSYVLTLVSKKLEAELAHDEYIQTPKQNLELAEENKTAIEERVAYVEKTAQLHAEDAATIARLSSEVNRKDEIIAHLQQQLVATQAEAQRHADGYDNLVEQTNIRYGVDHQEEVMSGDHSPELSDPVTTNRLDSSATQSSELDDSNFLDSGIDLIQHASGTESFAPAQSHDSGSTNKKRARSDAGGHGEDEDGDDEEEDNDEECDDEPKPKRNKYEVRFASSELNQ